MRTNRVCDYVLRLRDDQNQQQQQREGPRTVYSAIPRDDSCRVWRNSTRQDEVPLVLQHASLTSRLGTEALATQVSSSSPSSPGATRKGKKALLFIETGYDITAPLQEQQNEEEQQQQSGQQEEPLFRWVAPSDVGNESVDLKRGPATLDSLSPTRSHRVQTPTTAASPSSPSSPGRQQGGRQQLSLAQSFVRDILMSGATAYISIFAVFQLSDASVIDLVGALRGKMHQGRRSSAADPITGLARHPVHSEEEFDALCRDMFASPSFAKVRSQLTIGLHITTSSGQTHLASNEDNQNSIGDVQGSSDDVVVFEHNANDTQNTAKKANLLREAFVLIVNEAHHLAMLPRLLHIIRHNYNPHKASKKLRAAAAFQHKMTTGKTLQEEQEALAELRTWDNACSAFVCRLLCLGAVPLVAFRMNAALPLSQDRLALAAFFAEDDNNAPADEQQQQDVSSTSTPQPAIAKAGGKVYADGLSTPRTAQTTYKTNLATSQQTQQTQPAYGAADASVVSSLADVSSLNATAASPLSSSSQQHLQSRARQLVQQQQQQQADTSSRSTITIVQPREGEDEEDLSRLAKERDLLVAAHMDLSRDFDKLGEASQKVLAQLKGRGQQLTKRQQELSDAKAGNAQKKERIVELEVLVASLQTEVEALSRDAAHAEKQLSRARAREQATDDSGDGNDGDGNDDGAALERHRERHVATVKDFSVETHTMAAAIDRELLKALDTRKNKYRQELEQLRNETSQHRKATEDAARETHTYDDKSTHVQAETATAQRERDDLNRHCSDAAEKTSECGQHVQRVATLESSIAEKEARLSTADLRQRDFLRTVSALSEKEQQLQEELHKLTSGEAAMRQRNASYSDKVQSGARWLLMQGEKARRVELWLEFLAELYDVKQHERRRFQIIANNDEAVEHAGEMATRSTTTAFSPLSQQSQRRSGSKQRATSASGEKFVVAAVADCEPCAILAREIAAQEEILHQAQRELEAQHDATSVVQEELDQIISVQGQELNEVMNRVHLAAEKVQRAKVFAKNNVRMRKEEVAVTAETCRSLFSQLVRHVAKEAWNASRTFDAYVGRGSGEAKTSDVSASHHTPLRASATSSGVVGSPSPRRPSALSTHHAAQGLNDTIHHRSHNKNKKDTTTNITVGSPKTDDATAASNALETEGESMDRICSMYLEWLDALEAMRKDKNEATQLRGAFRSVEAQIAAAETEIEDDRRLFAHHEAACREMQLAADNLDASCHAFSFQLADQRRNIESAVEGVHQEARDAHHHSVIEVNGIVASIQNLETQKALLRDEANAIAEELQSVREPVSSLHARLTELKQGNEEMHNELQAVREAKIRSAQARSGSSYAASSSSPSDVEGSRKRQQQQQQYGLASSRTSSFALPATSNQRDAASAASSTRMSSIAAAAAAADDHNEDEDEYEYDHTAASTPPPTESPTNTNNASLRSSAAPTPFHSSQYSVGGRSSGASTPTPSGGHHVLHQRLQSPLN